MESSICKTCTRPCLGVGTEDHTWGLPSFLWEENTQSESCTLSPGEQCEYYRGAPREVYYVDSFGGRVPDSWLGVGGSPDDCWHRVEIY